jgi:hypothetical protein
MKLKIFIDDKQVPVTVPDEILYGAKEFFIKMNADMDKGWQMSRSWVENPSKVQRCQIAADKIMGAVHNENQNLLQMMAGYILFTLPDVVDIHIDGNGEMMETELVLANGTRLSDTIN